MFCAYFFEVRMQKLRYNFNTDKENINIYLRYRKIQHVSVLVLSCHNTQYSLQMLD
jgi:hypothetical protein